MYYHSSLSTQTVITPTSTLFLPHPFFSAVPCHPVCKQNLFRIKAWTEWPPHPLSVEWSPASSEKRIRCEVTDHVICQLSKGREKGQKCICWKYWKNIVQRLCINITPVFLSRDEGGLHLGVSNRGSEKLTQHSECLMMLKKNME